MTNYDIGIKSLFLSTSLCPNQSLLNIKYFQHLKYDKLQYWHKISLSLYIPRDSYWTVIRAHIGYGKCAHFAYIMCASCHSPKRALMGCSPSSTLLQLID